MKFKIEMIIDMPDGHTTSKAVAVTEQALKMMWIEVVAIKGYKLEKDNELREQNDSDR